MSRLTFNVFDRITKRHERKKLQDQVNELLDDLANVRVLHQKEADERDYLQNQVNKLSEKLRKEYADRKYDYLYFLQSGGQGDLFKRLLKKDHRGHHVKLENISCPEMYFSDRHSTIYELVSEIVIVNKTISNSHFESACFDTVTFRNVIFNKTCFYKTFFADVNFVNCTFNDCDFNESKGDNVKFKDCIQNNTDLTKIEVFEVDEQNIQVSEYEELPQALCINESSGKVVTEDRPKFFGYCFETVGGKYYPCVPLIGTEEVRTYVNLQKHLFEEIRITDESDCLVVHVLNGKIVFPEEWAIFNNDE